MTGAGEGDLQESTPNWRGTALQYPHNAQKMRSPKKTHRHKGTKKSGAGKGWCGKFGKKNNEHITGCGIFANRVPRFPLFPPSTLPLDDNNSFIWISQSCGKKKEGTTAGTRVLCTQYILRVAIEQWAFEGNSPISSLSDRGTTRKCLLNKLLQCPRGVMYKPKVPQQFDGNSLREGIRINGIRQHYNQKTMQIQKRIKAQCEACIRPTKRVVCPHTERSMNDVKIISLRKTRSRIFSPVHITVIYIDLFMSL